MTRRAAIVQQLQLLTASAQAFEGPATAGRPERKKAGISAGPFAQQMMSKMRYWFLRSASASCWDTALSSFTLS
ncbi:MAG: hypothetical protein ABIP44_04620, partial [Pseudoxanthomonas sp.]